jgi:hypothetical protein
MCSFLLVLRPLWWEDGSVIYSSNCYWALPALSLSVQVPQNFGPISYCLIWDSGPLFVVSCDSQSYGGGIVTRLHAWYMTTVSLTMDCTEHMPPNSSLLLSTYSLPRMFCRAVTKHRLPSSVIMSYFIHGSFNNAVNFNFLDWSRYFSFK